MPLRLMAERERILEFEAWLEGYVSGCIETYPNIPTLLLSLETIRREYQDRVVDPKKPWHKKDDVP